MRGMMFNGVHSDAFDCFEYCSPRVPLLPERRQTKIDLPGRDGTVDFENDSYLPRIVSVDCLLKDTSEENIRAKMAQIAVWLSGSGELIFDRDISKQWQAKVYNMVDPETYPLARRFTVMFECQPYAEDIEEITEAVLDVETDYGSDIPFFPRIIVTLGADTDTLQVTLQDTGEYVRIDDALQNEDEIIIDMAYGKATVNGKLQRVNLASLFFAVPPGDQQINITADGEYTATMTYRRRYSYA